MTWCVVIRKLIINIVVKCMILPSNKRYNDTTRATTSLQILQGSICIFIYTANKTCNYWCNNVPNNIIYKSLRDWELKLVSYESGPSF